MDVPKTRGECEPKMAHTYSKDLLDVGKNIKQDPLLIGKKKPYRMPPSSVLSQVKSFLPKMQEANCKLEEQLKTVPPEDLDIENIADCDQQVIEMNLALFAKDDGSSDDDEDIDANDDGGSSDEDSDSEALVTPGEINATNMKLPTKSRRPKRTMIEDLTGDAGIKEHDPRSEVGRDKRVEPRVSPPTSSEVPCQHEQDDRQGDKTRDCAVDR